MAKDREKEKEKEKMIASGAGRKGGEAVIDEYGPEHMSEIGRKGRAFT